MPKTSTDPIPATGAKTRLPSLFREALSLLPAVPALAIGATLLPTDSADAAVVEWNSNLTIPNNIDGQYINVQTGVFGSAAGLAAGWDLNPYGTSTATMSWFAAGAPSGCVTGLGTGGTITGVANLSVGTLVSSASTFGNTASGVANGGWKLNSVNNFGFRFTAADGLTHYGFGVMTVGATMGVRTLTSVSYEDAANTAITVTGTVPEPTTSLLAAGAAGLFALRRRRLAA
jgi:hypothetical protein